MDTTFNDFAMGIPIDFPQSNQKIIKVIGVGGGGGNAVNHMYREGIHDVTYVLCNTDRKALEGSPVPNHLQLGKDGLGAGNKPEKAREAATESLPEIREMLSDGTRMAFITAGMGGGTGTGAAPIIAQCAKDMGILTVGIVTIPFKFEGKNKIYQALEGVEKISQHVDALLVINNERLREVYQDLTLINAFAKADDTLSVAAKSIAEIITMRGIINLDFQDVTTVLKDGGVAIMSTGYGEGENRVSKAIREALNSPLLNNNDIYNSKKVLMNINFSAEGGADELMMEEVNEINDFFANFQPNVEFKWGLATDSTLGSKVKITLLATGFGIKSITGLESHSNEKRREEVNRDQERIDFLDEWASNFYANDNDANTRHKKHNVFLYEVEDLEDDNLIARVDTTPTAFRTREEVKHFRESSQDVAQNVE